MRQEILHIMPVRLRAPMMQALQGQTGVEEIRIRIGQPPEIRCQTQSVWLSAPIDVEDVEEMLTFISRYSIYAYEEEIRQGFVTIEGGNRIGFAGQVRLEDGRISRMTNIRFLNIRVASEQKGCAKEILPWLYEKGELLNTLFAAKPGVGKTTYLRDCVRMVSDGDQKRPGRKVCVIDERSEIAACHLGVPQNDIGKRTDVLDGCPKQEGMRMALRSMSPDVVAVDELGGSKDAAAVAQIMLSGCRVFGTVHGETMEQLLSIDGIGEMHRRKQFQRYVFLKRREDGQRTFHIYDQECRKLC